MVALSITSRGKTDEKLKWAFQLYDIDGNGSITREEMLEIVSAIYKMTGPMVKPSEDEDTPEKRVDKLFELMDGNKDGKIEFEEFKVGCQQDEKILSAMNLYEGALEVVSCS